MTDKEIIKALECCIKSKCAYDCEKLGCSTYRTGKCVYVKRAIRYEDFGIELMKDALNLIKRQQAEIESAKKVAEEAIRGFNRMESLYHIKCAELKTTKAEAIKEFAKRVKESPRKISMMSFTEEGISTYVPVHAIDNLVKEMTEGKDAGKDI